ncbi:MAG: DNA polymerase III subunit gamma/tau [Nitrospiraceae bacterium]|nr:DNA polymerase III subunit gamma/tau [Nitrospiraceae bacterium]
MEYQVSARKYRPGTFDDVIGQPHVVQTLMNAVSAKRMAHAYIFSGTRGVGKTTVARILAKALNCEGGPTGDPCNQCANCQEITQGNSVDVIEIDGASNTSVDDVREIRENVKFTPFRGQYRVYIIDEVHMLSNSAFNALLKTLEEPPAHVVFIFATTEIHKIPATILSRCQHYNFRRIARTDIVERLRHVARQDDLTIEERSFTALARASEGSMRDALSLLDQAIAFGGKAINHADLELLLGAVPQELVQDMIKAITAQDSPAALIVVAHLLDQGHDVKSFCADVVESLRNLLVAAVVPGQAELRGLIEASEEDVQHLMADAKTLSPEHLQEWMAIFIQAEESLRLSAHPRFVIETAAVRATRLLQKRENNTPVQTPSAQPAPRGTAGKQPGFAPPAPHAPAPAQVATANAAMHTSAAKPQPTSTAPSSPQPSARREPTHALPPSADHAPRPAGTAVAAPAISNSPAPLNWEAVQEEVAASLPNVAPFLEAGRFIGLEGGVVTIGFPKLATIARAMMEKDDNLKAVATLCERQTRQPIRIRIVELTITDPPGPTMAQLRAAKEQDQRQQLLERARTNPVVKEALEIFGAELADVRPVVHKEAE